MGTLSFEVKEFIEDNIELIEQNRWDEVYDNASFNLDSESTGAFTKCILDLGIDPISEQGLDYIPDYYLSDTDITKYTISERIHQLGTGCFSYTNLHSILIPKSVTQIDNYAFHSCLNLRYVTILCDTVIIGDAVFVNCPESLTLICREGSYAESYAKENSIKVEYIN